MATNLNAPPSVTTATTNPRTGYLRPVKPTRNVNPLPTPQPAIPIALYETHESFIQQSFRSKKLPPAIGERRTRLHLPDFILKRLNHEYPADAHAGTNYVQGGDAGGANAFYYPGNHTDAMETGALPALGDADPGTKAPTVTSSSINPLLIAAVVIGGFLLLRR